MCVGESECPCGREVTERLGKERRNATLIAFRFHFSKLYVRNYTHTQTHSHLPTHR